MPKSNKKNKPAKPIYLDFAASYEPNPSSIHALGVAARSRIESARRNVANFLNARPKEIIFTSGGTEANNLAIQGLVRRARLKNKMPHVITTNIEHPSVLHTLESLKASKIIDLTIVPVENSGIVDVKKIKAAILPNTVLVSVMLANNEIGTIEPIIEITKAVRHYKKTTGRNDIYLHTDAVQAVQYIELDVQKMGVDLLTISGTKVAGGRGAGVLYKRDGVVIEPLMYGGRQEYGLRPGTENNKAIIAMSKSLALIAANRVKETKIIETLQKYFWQKITKSKIFAECGILINGSIEHRLPNNTNVTFPKIPSDLLVLELSALGIMASSKSACESSEEGGSYVVNAVRPEIAKDIGGLRFSFGLETTKKDLDFTIKNLEKIINKLKKWYY